MSGIVHPVEGDIRAVDDGRSIIIPEEAESQGSVFGVWGVCGVGVAGIPSTDAAREVSGREAALGDHAPRRISMNLQYGFPKRRGAEELYYGGVLGMGSVTDGNTGPLPTPARLGHHDHTG